MIKFDSSRFSFDEGKHYVGVFTQQGRVVIDSDKVEGEIIDLERERKTQEDVIGSYGSPDNGFSISDLRQEANGLVNFDIADGTIYLAGMRLEMEVPETFLVQKDWLYREGDPYKPPVLQPGQQQYDLVYLEAWQQNVSAVEDSSLFETALGGPDTTTRVRNMRRIKIQSNNKFGECALSWAHLKEKWKNEHLGVITDRLLTTNLQLKVSLSGGEPEDLCSPAAAGGYLGAENQAIRVQVVKKEGKNYFTWGFDNASPLYRVLITPAADPSRILVKMETLPKDQFHWPSPGQVVEILPWSAELSNNEKIAEEYGFMSRVQSGYKPDEKTFEIETIADLPSQEYYYLRVWNRGADTGSAKLIEFNTTDTYTLGNTGVQLQFGTNNSEEAEVLTGDYWVIAVRPETPNQVYPWALETGMLPIGTKRYYSPLAIILWKADGNGNLTGELIADCRNPFHPLTHHDCCCTYSVGDGVTSHGDFDSLQEAINHLPAKGGKICLLPGVHTANAVITGKRFVHISGCGIHTIVHADVKDQVKRFEPVFLVRNSQWITLENMTILAPDGIGVKVEDEGNATTVSREIMIRNNDIIAFIHAIRIDLPVDISSGHHVSIMYNRIGMINAATNEQGSLPGVAIFSLADDAWIERNRLSIVPFRGGGGGGGNDDDDDDDDDCDCDVILRLFKRIDVLRSVVMSTIEQISLKSSFVGSTGYYARGGIQVGCGSTKVMILRNEIFGGAGHGIILGHHVPNIILFSPQPAPSPATGAATTAAVLKTASARVAPGISGPPVSINGISIEKNEITGMYLCGISTDEPDSLELSSLIHIGDISIYRNEIYRCALRPPQQNVESKIQPAYGGINLAICDVVAIRENRIEENGMSMVDPICGIYILYANAIDISGNKILYNGKLLVDAVRGLNKGHRSGIFIRSVSKQMTTSAPLSIAGTGLETYVPGRSADASPAVTIHDNLVVHPMGRALTLSALATVSITDNQFTSQGIDRDGENGLTAGTILIMNYGSSKTVTELLRTIILRMYGVPYFNGNGVNSNLAGASLAAIKNAMTGGKVLFANNQSTLDLSAGSNSVCISSQAILTTDDIGFHDNQSTAVSDSSSVDLVAINTLAATASTIRVSDNLFDDQADFTALSLVSWGAFNTTSCNQSTHCIMVIGAKKINRDNMVLSGAKCAGLVREAVNTYGTNLAEGRDN